MYKGKLVVAKKRKRCAWCGEWAEAEEQRWNRAYVFDGEFQSDVLHPECHGALRATDDLSDGFEFGQFRRGMTAEETEDIIDAEWRAEEEAAELAEEVRP